MYRQQLDKWNDKRSGSDIEADAIRRAQEETGTEDYTHSQLLNKIDPRTKTTTRNWRMRESVAGYLLNLDADTPGYDGKTRALKEYQVGREADQEEDQLYRDSWMKISGDMEALVQEEEFAQKAAEKGADLHPTADPSLTEMMFRSYKEKQEELKAKKAAKVVGKYGGTDHMKAPEETVTEAYSQPGKPAKRIKTTEFPEDVLVLGHKAVWGSWFDLETQLWGMRSARALIERPTAQSTGGQSSNNANFRADRVTLLWQEHSRRVPSDVLRLHSHQPRLHSSVPSPFK
jgi:pre-mRNA-processing factor SLU7